MEGKKELFDVSAKDFVPYQVCPKCDGGGSYLSSQATVYRGNHFSGWETRKVRCVLCEGEKVIPMHKVADGEVMVSEQLFGKDVLIVDKTYLGKGISYEELGRLHLYIKDRYPDDSSLVGFFKCITDRGDKS